MLWDGNVLGKGWYWVSFKFKWLGHILKVGQFCKMYSQFILLYKLSDIFH